MQIELVEQFSRETEIQFDGEVYRVRDNGAVYRKHDPNRRRRRADEVWTFGRRDQKSRYMRIGSHSVHRIVAVAFLGAPPSNAYVVDHIDTDRSNNCASNLRWIHRLENLIRHPSVREQIISACGSLDRFFDDPSSALELDPGYEWLKSVSKAEARRARERLRAWAISDGRPPSRGFVRRVYGVQPSGPPIPELVQDTQSLTPIALQRSWKTLAEFPCCPTTIGTDPLGDYARNLPPGVIFTRDRYKASKVEMVEQGEGLLSVLIASTEEHPVKPWGVVKVTVEDGKFIHEAIRTFFELNGAKKAYFELLGIPFDGESIDDYC